MRFAEEALITVSELAIGMWFLSKMQAAILGAVVPVLAVMAELQRVSLLYR